MASVRTHPPASTVDLSQTPWQTPLQPSPTFNYAGHRVAARAVLSLEATVLGAQRYTRGPESALSPLDLALGWGPMAQPEVFEALGITQSGRWYHYRWGPEGPPIPRETIIRTSSNVHVVPASPELHRRLLGLAEGDRVRLQGWLIDVERPDGARWTTSLTRDDSGAGACEILYVCGLDELP